MKANGSACPLVLKVHPSDLTEKSLRDFRGGHAVATGEGYLTHPLEGPSKVDGRRPRLPEPACDDVQLKVEGPVVPRGRLLKAQADAVGSGDPNGRSAANLQRPDGIDDRRHVAALPVDYRAWEFRLVQEDEAATDASFPAKGFREPSLGL